DNVPEVMVQGFATKYAAGTKYVIGQIVGAANSAIINRNTGATAPDNVKITTAEVLANVNQKLNYLYTSLEAKQLGATYEVDIPPIILAVFPPAQRESLGTLLATTEVTVPQMLLIVQGMMDTIQAIEPVRTYDLNPAVMCQAAGITMFEGVGAGQSVSGLKIMHAEVRTTNYVAWGDNDTAPVPALESYVGIQNFAQGGAPSYPSVEVVVAYPKYGGGTGIATYEVRTGGMGGGGQEYTITPYNNNGADATLVTDFVTTEGTRSYTITVYQSGEVADYRTVELLTIPLAAVGISLNSPRENDFTRYPEGTTPVFNWTTTMNGVNIPSTHRLAYCVNIGQQSGQTWTNKWNSWDKRQFIYGTSFPSPVTYEAGQQYSINVSVVVISQNGGQPISQGKNTNASFMMGTPTPEALLLSGEVTPYSGTTWEVKVGLFKETYVQNQQQFVSSKEAVLSTVITRNGTSETPVAFTLPVSTLTFEAGNNYQIIAWEDKDGNGRIDMGSSMEMMFYSNKGINTWGGMINTWDNMTGMNRPLKDSLTGFNCDLTWNGTRNW
ncbi:MAG: hypothetical protein ABH860_03245, partial [bacterium]